MYETSFFFPISIILYAIVCAIFTNYTFGNDERFKGSNTEMIAAQDTAALFFAFLVVSVILFFTWVDGLIGSVMTEGVKPITHPRWKVN